MESMKCQMELWLSSRFLIFCGFVNVWLQPRLEKRVLRVRGHACEVWSFSRRAQGVTTHMYHAPPTFSITC